MGGVVVILCAVIEGLQAATVEGESYSDYSLVRKEGLSWLV